MAAGTSSTVGESIQAWNASFYDNQTKTWLYGSLHLSSTALYFVQNTTSNQNPSDDSIVTCIEFCDVQSVNKTLSSFLFGAITVVTNDGQTLWFSSFADRNSVFLVLQHFHKAYLCSSKESVGNQGNISGPKTSQGRTKLGTEILRSLHDSQKTLEKAGSQLLAQGEQLANSAVTVQGIHENLTVAERITGGLEGWLGRWRLPTSKKSEDLIFVMSNDIPDILDVEALCCQITVDKYGPRKPCVFRVGKEGLTILDMKQKILHDFKWSNISRIRVVTPWEILVTRFLIGQPDLSYSIIYEAMATVLRMLEPLAGNKMEYLNPPQQFYLDRHREKQTRPVVSQNSKQFSSDSQRLCSTDQGSMDGTQSCTQQVIQQVVNDAEISEMCSALSNLKSLALEVQKEQDSQLDSIDHLTDSVVKADARQKKLNLRAKNLT